MMVVTAIALLWQSASFASCTAIDDNAAGQYEQATFIPQAPDYNDAAMWVTSAQPSTIFRLIATRRVRSSSQASVRVVWLWWSC